jgi:hypothetical protein
MVKRYVLKSDLKRTGSHFMVYLVHLGRTIICCNNIDFWWGRLREGDHWGDPDVDGRIILRWIFRKWKRVVGTGWSGLRIGTGGGHLWVW